MGTQNSLVPVSILGGLFKDFRVAHPSDEDELVKDFETIKRRYASEGLSFLTKTLPKLGKAFDRALQGDVPLSSPGFAWRRGYPVFLQGFFRRIFSPGGVILAQPDVTAISHVRQLLYIFYKLELPYAPSVEREKVLSFVLLDKNLHSSDDHLTYDDRLLLARASALVCAVFEGFDPSRIKPSHGPGAVADGQQPWEKMHYSRRYSRLEAVYPCWEYLWPSDHKMHPLRDVADWYRSLSVTEYGWSVMKFVPKDSRGPRIIGEEPEVYMLIQQGLKALMYKHIESHPLTRGHVNFTDQSVNRDLALQSSKSGEFVTLDLDEASNRVSLWLVKLLFKNQPDLLEALMASRTEGTILPDGTELPFRKFAPMGSAVCFPIEAMVFWALSVAAISVRYGVPLLLARQAVYVYGDDVIVRSDWQDAVRDTLSNYDLKLSESKCCVSGHFRESCGMDAFSGVDVTPIKVKHLSGTSLQSSSDRSLVSMVSNRNAFYARGYEETTRVYDVLIKARYPGIPYLPQEELEVAGYPALCHSGIPFYPTSLRRRYNADLQRKEVRVKVLSAVQVKACQRYAWAAVAESLLKGDQRPAIITGKSDPLSSKKDDSEDLTQWSYSKRYSARARWAWRELITE